MKVVEEGDINPLKNGRYKREAILDILNDDFLVLSLNRASDKRKKTPEVIVKKAVRRGS